LLLHIVARGRIGRGPEADLVERYLKRVSWPTKVSELPDIGGRVPDLDPAFARLNVPPVEEATKAQLERDLNNQLQRAATHAFRNAFLIGAALALTAMLSLIPLRRRGER